MEIELKYFGQIAELTGKETETYTTSEVITGAQLITKVLEKHPLLKDFNYQLAVNKKLNALEEQITTDTECALLPPFAGG